MGHAILAGVAFLAAAGPGRSGAALRVAAVAIALFVLLVVLFNARYAWREPLLRFGFPLNALLFHAGLGLAIAARLGDPDKRGRHPGWALLANGVPVVLFWVMVYGIVQAIRNFQ